jgi:hypothetical protein
MRFLATLDYADNLAHQVILGFAVGHILKVDLVRVQWSILITFRIWLQVMNCEENCYFVVHLKGRRSLSKCSNGVFSVQRV